MKNKSQIYKVSTSSLLYHMNDSLHKVVAAPAIRRRQLNNKQEEVNEANETKDDVKIPLMEYTIALSILWAEFEFVIGRNKPAKDFTAKERCMVKFAYCLWNPF